MSNIYIKKKDNDKEVKEKNPRGSDVVKLSTYEDYDTHFQGMTRNIVDGEITMKFNFAENLPTVIQDEIQRANHQIHSDCLQH